MECSVLSFQRNTEPTLVFLFDTIKASNPGLGMLNFGVRYKYRANTSTWQISVLTR
jgi:hypothetical protein